jgi:hypothetical protein
MSPVLARASSGKLTHIIRVSSLALGEAEILPEMVAAGAGGGDDVGDQQFGVAIRRRGGRAAASAGLPIREWIRLRVASAATSQPGK